jgi:multiple sugar transport system permease protein
MTKQAGLEASGRPQPDEVATSLATTTGKTRRDAFTPRGWARWAISTLLVFVTLVVLFPFYSMVALSLQPSGAVTFPDSLLPWPITFEAYHEVFETESMLRWLENTLVYALVSVLLVLFLSSLAGYAFAKMRFPGREVMFWSMLSMVMVPYHITLIPIFVLMARLGGVDTYWGLILPTLANTQAIFLMRQFIASIPDELLDAARVDGCSEWRIYVSIVLPLCKPILATLGVFIFLWHWNDFLWPLIMTQDTDMRTLTVGIATLRAEVAPLNVQLAGAGVAFAPIFVAYLFGQRYLKEGATMSGLKG